MVGFTTILQVNVCQHSKQQTVVKQVESGFSPSKYFDLITIALSNNCAFYKERKKRKIDNMQLISFKPH